jgi:hypothetical protein
MKKKKEAVLQGDLTTEEPVPVPDEAPPEAPQAIGSPDMIRIMGNGSIGVDDERWLGTVIPTGSAYFSEEVVDALHAELAETQEALTTARAMLEEATERNSPQNDVTAREINMRGALLAVPVGKLIDLTNAALNLLSLRQLAVLLYDAGIEPELKLVSRTEDAEHSVVRHG